MPSLRAPRARDKAAVFYVRRHDRRSRIGVRTLLPAQTFMRLAEFTSLHANMNRCLNCQRDTVRADAVNDDLDVISNHELLSSFAT
jgi:hypothetical protein